VSDQSTFDAVADALIRERATDKTKTTTLAALMDCVGVPMMSLQRYRDDEVIVALFASRGVRFAAPEEMER
jgi:hypothetical protein